MSSPVRYPGGVTDVRPGDAFAHLPTLNPTRLVQYFNDFHLYTAGDWIMTETQAAATQAASDAAGGVLLLTNATGNTDVNQLQLANETFRLTSGKQCWIKARFALTAATFANFGGLVGLAIKDTSAVAGVSDGIFFRKPAGAATLSAVLCKDAAETTLAMGSMATATFVTAALHYNGKNAVNVWLNDGLVGGITTLTNLPDDEELTVTLASVNATAGAANVLSVDYIYAAIER